MRLQKLVVASSAHARTGREVNPPWDVTWWWSTGAADKLCCVLVYPGGLHLYTVLPVLLPPIARSIVHAMQLDL